MVVSTDLSCQRRVAVARQRISSLKECAPAKARLPLLAPVASVRTSVSVVANAICCYDGSRLETIYGEGEQPPQLSAVVQFGQSRQSSASGSNPNNSIGKICAAIPGTSMMSKLHTSYRWSVWLQAKQKWHITLDRSFPATANLRNEAMMHEAAEFAVHLKRCEKDIRTLKNATEGPQLRNVSWHYWYLAHKLAPRPFHRNTDSNREA